MCLRVRTYAQQLRVVRGGERDCLLGLPGVRMDSAAAAAAAWRKLRERGGGGGDSLTHGLTRSIRLQLKSWRERVCVVCVSSSFSAADGTARAFLLDLWSSSSSLEKET